MFHSGNQTTTVSEGAACDDGNLNDNTVPGPCTVFGVSMPGGLPLPERNVQNIGRPETGLIVKFNNGVGQWNDQLNRNWNNAVKFTLPDLDVFKIDANANPPAQIGPDSAQFAHVGTVLFSGERIGIDRDEDGYFDRDELHAGSDGKRCFKARNARPRRRVREPQGRAAVAGVEGAASPAPSRAVL